MHIDTLQKKLIGGVTVLLLAFGAAVLWPVIRESSKLRAEIAETKQKLASTQAETAGLASVAASVKQIRSEISTNNKRIPTQGETAELLRELTTELQSQRLSDPSITSMPSVPGADYTRLPIQIAFKGSAMGAFRFINKVEAMPRLVHMQRLHLQASDKQPDQVDADLELHTFTYTNSQESAP